MKSNSGGETKNNGIKTLTKIMSKMNSRVLNLGVERRDIVSFDFVKHID